MNYNNTKAQKFLPDFLSSNFAQYSVFKPISYDIINDLKKNDTSLCPICLKNPKAYCRPNSCFHLFCNKCLFQWNKRKRQCPLCRKNFTFIIKI